MNRMNAVLIATAVAILPATSVWAGPLLTIPEPEFDFGYIPQNSKVAHVFWLHNTGDQEMKIAKVNPGCGCTQAPLDKEIVPPGDSARLEIIFSSRLYFERVVKTPVIEIAGLADPHTVKIISYVVPRPDSTFPLRLEPFKLDISQYGEAVRDRASLEITNVSDKELAISLIAGVEDIGTLTLPPTVGPGQTVTAELVLKPEALANELERSFTFEVGDEHHSRYTVPIRRKLRDPRVGQLTAPAGE
ncbi:MAG: DUF1573 domain-containing protein [Candidatus Zixiibacteriota bacterium]